MEILIGILVALYILKVLFGPSEECGGCCSILIAIIVIAATLALAVFLL